MADENKTPENTNTPESNAKGKRCKRKTSHKVVIAAGLVAVVGAAAIAGAAHSSGWGGHGYGYGHSKNGQMMKMFQEFDANDDGKVTKGELDSGRMSHFSNADADGNAALSINEFQGMWMQFMRPHMVDKFQMLDDDGDGEVTEREFQKPFNMIMRHMDRNDDGAISMKEIKRKHRWHDDDDRYERDDDDDESRDKD